MRTITVKFTFRDEDLEGYEGLSDDQLMEYAIDFPPATHEIIKDPEEE